MSGFRKPNLPYESPANGVAITPSNSTAILATVGADLTTRGVVVSEIQCGGAGVVCVDYAANNGLYNDAGAVQGAYATGTLTAAGVTGTVGETIAGTAVTVTAADTDDATTATALAVAIDANGTIGSLVNASAGGAGGKVVTVTAVNAGPAYNYNLVASGTGVTASGATLTGGTLATGVVTFGGGGGGQVGAVVNGTTVTVAWNVNPTTTGDDFVTALEADPTVGGAWSSAVNNAGTVTITVTNPATPAQQNGYSLAASGTDVSVSGATFGTGAGATAAVAATGTLTLSGVTGAVGGTINGTLVTVTAADTDDAATIVLFRDAVNANATVSPFVTATAAAKVATLTADFPGKFGNAVTTVASGTGMTANAATLTGGTGGSGNYVAHTVVAGEVLYGWFNKVYATGTTATLLIGRW